MQKGLENIITIDSNKKGPVVTIMGGVHGNEPCGVDAINMLKDSLKIKNGKVHLIFGNPRAIENNVREMELNLNRSFRDDKNMSDFEKGTYEYARSRKIMPYLDESDVLLDIHSTSAKGTPPFIICSEKSMEIAKYFPYDYVCDGFDNFHSGSTDYYMSKNRKIGICIECGYHKDVGAKKLSMECVENLLDLLGMVENKSKHNINSNQNKLIARSIYKTKTNEFVLTKDFANFEEIKKGQHIATDGVEKIFSDKDQVILFAHNRDKSKQEGFLLLGSVI